ncbi:MAG: hypothetical protein ACOC6G_04465, partial [Thermoproteota archaeon]
MKRFPKQEYSIPFFKEEGFIRKLCPKCHEYFWTQNPEQETCRESTPEGCAFYSFINDPPTKKNYSLRGMREAFISFFKKQGHTVLNPYPVVA